MKLKNESDSEKKSELREQLKGTDLEYEDLEKDNPYVISNMSVRTGAYTEKERDLKKVKNLFTKMIIFIIVGGVLFFAGSGGYLSNKRFLAKAEQTDGVVTNVDRSHSRRGGTTYRVTSRYLVGEKYYTYKYSTSLYTREGEAITIYYDPNEPSKCSDGQALSFMQMLGCIIGVFLMIFGVIVAILCEKNPEKAFDMYENLQNTTDKLLTPRWKYRK